MVQVEDIKEYVNCINCGKRLEMSDEDREGDPFWVVPIDGCEVPVCPECWEKRSS